MEYRTATTDDIPEMCRIRNLQLIDEGYDAFADINSEMEDFFSRKLSDGSLVQWMAIDDGKIIATAAILFLEITPSFSHQNGLVGYITDMYTAPEYRRQGIASNLLSKLREEAERRGAKRLMLGASEYGKPVYRRFGFSDLEDWMDMHLD